VSQSKLYKFAFLAAVGLLGLGATRSAHAEEYTLTDLGDLGGGFSIAFGVNNAGQAVGTSEYAPPNNTAVYPVLWSGGPITVLGDLGGTSEAYGINSTGIVVGYSYTLGGSARIH
jgi:uncharacterized membrane protein